MIKEISVTRLFEICQPQFQKKGQHVLLTRLCSNAKCFQPKRLCIVYEIEKGGSVCGVMCRYGGSITLCLFKKPDLAELCSFLSAAAITTLECSTKTARKISKALSLTSLKGEIFYMKNSPRENTKYRVFETENASDFFDVLKAADLFYKTTSYEEYYCDLFYRAPLPARLFLAEFNGTAAATAAILHRYQNISIISDVAVLTPYRRRGLASALVSEICRLLISEGQVPTLLCNSPTARLVYKKIGFRRCGRFCLLSFSQKAKDDV